MESTGGKIVRTRDRVVGGVCGGIAAYFGLDPVRVRLATVVLALFAGLALWIYILLWFVIPEEPLRK